MRTPFLFLLLLFVVRPIFAAEVKIDDQETGKLRITLDGEKIAEYVYQDPGIPRPYFAAVYAPGGGQITRTHPPDPKLDVADHPLFHPGIWLSFGDLSGSDYWRNAARVEFIDFPKSRRSSENGVQFSARFRYLDQKESSNAVCEELFDCQILAIPAGTLIVWDSTFSSDHEFTFGDQEEMGLGIRMATALRSEPQARGEIASGTGTILDAEGRKNGEEVWGNSAPWCDYSGTIDGQQIGATLLCYPDNFRPSWFHARDYGLLVANPFGRKAFHHGDASNITVKPGEKLRLRYGILLHAGEKPDLNAAYQEYVKLTSSEQ
jgi:hypothetical protein